MITNIISNSNFTKNRKGKVNHSNFNLTKNLNYGTFGICSSEGGYLTSEQYDNIRNDLIKKLKPFKGKF